MATYRERREARAARLREWAEKRQQKAAAAAATAKRIGDGIPFGQPILVGHHSEKRHRKDANRIHRAMDASLEHGAKARDMDRRADGIEAQLDRSIYSDDPDAVERLRERIAEMEAARARIAAYNASCRKGAADLTLLDDAQRANLASIQRHAPYQLRDGGQFPAYATSNLSGNINRLRKRLAALEAGG